MWRTSIIIFLLFTLFGCGITTDQKPIAEAKEELIEKEQQVLPKGVVNDGFPRLSDANAVDFLTDYGAKNPETRVIMESKFGTIEVELFKDTPLHRANFIYLVKRGYYSPTEILRVIKGFMIQGGNSEEPGPAAKRFMIGDYCLPAEMTMKHVHHRGALAMSRSYTDNPDKCSSAYDFYLVQGTKYKNVHIFQAEQDKGISYSNAQKIAYKEQGGAVHLDMEHTVFGRVVKGLKVIDEICEVEVDGSNWPKNYIEFNMTVE